jgi:hypothetical protein
MEEIHKRVSSLFKEYLCEMPKDASGSYNYKIDIYKGEIGENFVKEFLISKGFNFVRENHDFRYDLLMSYNGSQVKYEVKTDIFLSKDDDTGNMVIEFESRGKPSGISVCEADYYVYYIPKLGELWNIKMDDLKSLIEKNKFKTVTGGDKGSDTKMYLIKRWAYIKHFNFYRV